MIRIVIKLKEGTIKTYKTMKTKPRMNQYCDCFSWYKTENEGCSL